MTNILNISQSFKFFLASIMILLLLWNKNTLASTEDARAFVEQITKQAFDIIENPNEQSNQKTQDLKNLFNKYIDINWIAKFTLGRYLRTMTPAQIKDFNILFDQYLTNNYVSNFKNFTSKQLKIEDILETNQNEYLVKTTVINTLNNTSLKVNFRLFEKPQPAGFVVFDIAIEGISMISTQRSEFNSIISQLGINGMLNSLKEKNAQIKQ